MNYYSIQEFAKIVGVSKKTIQYYEEQGLMKPTFVKENGYRFYTEEDISHLQRILMLKYIGLSMKEIKELQFTKDYSELLSSFLMQSSLLEHKIQSLISLKNNIKALSDKLEEDKEIQWSEMIRFVKILSMGDELIEHYKNSININARINLHKEYSTAVEPWYQWVFAQFNFTIIENKKRLQVLEIGSGNGELWRTNLKHFPIDIELHITDISMGMIQDAKVMLEEVTENDLYANRNSRITFERVDSELLPYLDDSMDIIIANHMLFYGTDLKKRLSEITRVLKADGTLYCTTYSSNHMKEVEQLMKGFDSRISLSSIKLYEIFGLDNGRDILSDYFDQVEVKYHKDGLVNVSVDALYHYIESCHGNQNEYILPKKNEFMNYLKEKSKSNFTITKNAGIFICSRKRSLAT